MEKTTRLYQIVSQIPKGKVTTYGKLAKLSGIKSPRVVGNLLHKNPCQKKIPCHRVVNSKGEPAANFAFCGKQEQIKRLQAEGVEMIREKVNLTNYLWVPSNL
ncbi:MAG TPA: methylated-DNA--[protein]-cysteine S-methyltransferase [Candidatus Nanoarchaeia archaeon]